MVFFIVQLFDFDQPFEHGLVFYFCNLAGCINEIIHRNGEDIHAFSGNYQALKGNSQSQKG